MKTFGIFIVLIMATSTCLAWQNQPNGTCSMPGAKCTNSFKNPQQAVDEMKESPGVVINPSGAFVGDPTNTGLNKVYWDFNDTIGKSSGGDHTGMRLATHIAPSNVLEPSRPYDTFIINNHVAAQYSGSGGRLRLDASVNGLKVISRADREMSGNILLNGIVSDVAHVNVGKPWDEHAALMLVNQAESHSTEDHAGMWGEDLHVLKPNGTGDGEMVGIEIGIHKGPPVGRYRNYGLHIWCGNDSPVLTGATDCGDAIHIGAPDSETPVGASWKNIISVLDGTGTKQIFKVDGTGDVTAKGLRTGEDGNTDLAGQLTLHGGKVSREFTESYASPPICTANSALAARPVAVQTTVHTLILIGTPNDIVNYICIGRR